jgi:C-terminal processing protease CtpA/Prc
MKTFAFTLACLFSCFSAVFAQNVAFEQDRHVSMLRLVRDDVKKNYYDPQFRGIKIDEHFKKAEEKIKASSSVGQMSGIIAQALVDFNDSHLFFLPPGKANRTRYGFEMQMIGNRCFVIRVSEKSDAFKKGLQVGDERLEIEGFAPTRKDLWLMNYYFRALRPKPVLTLAIRKPDGKESRTQIESIISQGRRVLNLATSSMDINQYIRESEDSYNEARKQFVYEDGNRLMIWQMPAFNLEPSEVDSIMDKAKGKEALILDLRNNGGGYVNTMKRLVGHFFDKDIKIGDEKTRKEVKEEIAKTRGKDIFRGKLIVLVDSESGSASEVFARVVQLENRGKVFGDVTAGAVMTSRTFMHDLGLDTIIVFGTSVTVSDLIMTDGKSLEKTGVSPDTLLLPSGSDLATKRDPVLSQAVRSFGVEMSPEQAGALFDKQKKNYKDDF